jgi:hypothetical protein
MEAEQKQLKKVQCPAGEACQSYKAMHTRTSNPNHHSYREYGARGVKVCERWSGPGGLKRFMEDMGPRPAGKTLHRRDNNLGYSLDNCCWATWEEQNNHRRARRWKKRPVSLSVLSVEMWKRNV